MAMSAMALPPDHVRAMDQLRTRLSQLSTAIVVMQQQLAKHDPLPPWPALQQASLSLGANMEELATTLNQQRQLFASLHPYPLPTFPGTTHEMLLQQLLRKKLDPKAEDWIEESLHISEERVGEGLEAAELQDDDARELWAWASAENQARVQKLMEEEVFVDDYTIREREQGIENVVTGIRRRLGDEDSEDDDDDDDDEDGDKMEEDAKPKIGDSPLASGIDPARPPMPLDTLLKFASGADVPGF